MQRASRNCFQATTALLVLMLLTACGGGGGGGGQNPPPPPTATAPSITGQPQNQTVADGDGASFSVTASGTAPLQYQWRRNGTNIAGATSATLALAATSTQESGHSFAVVVTNSAGSATSSAAVLTVTAIAPAITAQPQNTTVVDGEIASFSITATGSAPLQYQWRRNGTDIAGATSATLTLPPTSTQQSGDSFTVVVTNAGGSVTSAAANLTVTAIPPAITSEPQPQSVLVGGTATFSVGVSGSAPLGLQWRRDGVDIPGATAATLTLSSLTLADDGVQISVVASNAGGSAQSANALLTVAEPQVAPTITQAPQPTAVAIGATATFTVTAAGNPLPEFQWRRNGTSIPGATSATLVVPSVTLNMTGQVYSVVVSNALGSVTSAGAVLTVNPPAITPAIIGLTANDLIYDRFRNLVYASVPATDSIEVIDPTTGGIVAALSIPVGADPGVLAISDDMRYLYVGLKGESAVERVDLETRQVDLSIPLMPYFLPEIPAFAEDIAVVPGSPRSFAVSQQFDGTISPRFAGLVVYDDATQRGPKIANLSAPLEFASPARLFSYDNQTSAYTLYTMTLGAGGLTTPNMQMNLIMGVDVDIEYDGGFMFATSGEMIDPELRVLFGFFPVDGTAKSVSSDLARERAYFLANPGGAWEVQSFSTGTFRPAGSIETNDVSASAGSLIRCGFDGLAFRTSDGSVHLIAIDSLQLPPAPADPGPGVMSLVTNDLIYDPVRGLIYASVPGRVPEIGNAVVAIDPDSETIVGSIFVGSEPNKLVMSDDSAVLYVSLDGAPKIPRIELDTFTNDATIVQSSFGRGIYVADMAVKPGDNDSLAVARKNCCFTPSQMGVAVYEQGTALPNIAFNESVLLAFGASNARLYGYEPLGNFDQLRRMIVDGSGVTFEDADDDLIDVDASEIKYDSGLLFLNSLAVDPENGALEHTYAATGTPLSIVPEMSSNRVYVLTTPAANTWRIEGFNANTEAAVGALAIANSAASAGSLVRWGADGLAFRTAGGRIYLRRLGDLQ